MNGAILLKMMYGYSIDRQKPDLLVEINNRMMSNFSLASVPGLWLVDMLPVLKYVPDWMPWTTFKSIARKSKQVNTTTAEVSFQFTKSRQHYSKRNHDPVPSFVGDLLRAHNDGPGNMEDAIKWTAVSVYSAGIDTTGSSIRSFFLAMSLFPDVQKRAQQEIDKVVGPGRLPSFGDRHKLPYTNAIVKETLRWLPVVPMGIPHASENDDVFRGYHIPKGSILLPAMWWFTHDPQVYHDPESFMPERFLLPFQEPDPAGFVFGYGRRICPGRRLADSTIFLCAAKTLAVFEISKARDAEGREIHPDVGLEPGSVSKASPFSVRVVLRDETHAELVRSVEMEDPLGEGDALSLDQSALKSALQ